MAIYVTKAGDMWDAIAYQQLGSSRYTDLLMNLNQSFRNTLIFPSGVSLTLPEIDPVPNHALPPWKRKVIP